MSESTFRIEKDSMDEVKVPSSALYGAQTQRAVDNFPISDLRFPRAFIKALAMIKGAAAAVNQNLGLMQPEMSAAIQKAAAEVANGQHDANFPLDIFQTGSGTSTNMNANEVLSSLATRFLGSKVHPNDHINLSQEVGGWAAQIEHNIARLEATLPRLAELAQGGTAVGTGINAHPEFGRQIAAKLAEMTGLPFVTSPNYFLSMSTQDTAVEVSGQLKTLAVSLIKISNDLRWMNSGPIAGFGEIALPALQPGSSIMPGKINPVIPEAVMMVSIGGQHGNFQLNVMLPVIAYNLIQSITLLAKASHVLADQAIAGFTVNEERINSLVGRNPIIVTALNPVIGYELGAKIAKQAYAEGRLLKDVALEKTSLTSAELDRLLDPRQLTEGGIQE